MPGAGMLFVNSDRPIRLSHGGVVPRESSEVLVVQGMGFIPGEQVVTIIFMNVPILVS